MAQPFCDDCSAPLTNEERYYYDHRCERCERLYWQRLRRWAAGGEDPALDSAFDALFGPPLPETLH